MNVWCTWRAQLTISVYIPDSRMSPLIVRRRNLDRYGRAVDDSINEVVAVLLFALSELVEHFHCLFLSPLMVAMGSTCDENNNIIHMQCSLMMITEIYLCPTFIPFPVITWMGTTEPMKCLGWQKDGQFSERYCRIAISTNSIWSDKNIPIGESLKIAVDVIVSAASW